MQKTKDLLKKAAYIASLLPSMALASNIPGGVTPVPGNEDITLLDVIQNIITWILGLAAAVAVLFLLIGGIKYIASQGNADSIEGAKHTILYSVIGLLIIVLSFIIVTWVSGDLAGGLTK